MMRYVHLLLWMTFWSSQAAFGDIRVTLLGTGSPAVDPNRMGPSTLVEAGSQKLLFDVGRGSIVRLGEIGLLSKDVTHVFFTHFHSDHVVGFPDLWLTGLTPPGGRRQESVRISGPEGVVNMMSALERAYADDIVLRLGSGLPEAAARLVVNEFESGGVVLEESGVRVTAIRVDHGGVKPAFGYRIDYDGRSVTISGDTAFTTDLIEAAQGTDLLLHEVAFFDDSRLERSALSRRINRHHTTPEDAGRVFQRVSPKLAVYTHIILAGEVNIQALISRTRQSYKGPLVVGQDLMSFDVGESVSIWKRQ